ncbi:MAG: hypothetical protein K5876_02370 [Ruminiclostridium sp.]|nr:hypothetical protein [Ruminiclostridium sp.]
MKKSRMIAVIAAAVVSASALAVSASAYNAYIGLQTQTYSFRNAWTEGSYGAATPYFSGWVVWGDGDTPEESFPEYEDNFDYDINGYVLPATYTDAVIEADGTYTVKAEGIDWGLKGETDFNLVFVSTDLPAGEGIVIKDASVAVDGTVVKTLDTVTYDETAQYIEIDFANIWNPDVGSWGLAFPTSDVAITFTVEGLGSGESAAAASVDAAADAGAATAGDTTAAAASSKGSPDTGVADVAAVAGLAIAAGAGIALTRKRK